MKRTLFALLCALCLCSSAASAQLTNWNKTPEDPAKTEPLNYSEKLIVKGAGLFRTGYYDYLGTRKRLGGGEDFYKLVSSCPEAAGYAQDYKTMSGASTAFNLVAIGCLVASIAYQLTGDKSKKEYPLYRDGRLVIEEKKEKDNKHLTFLFAGLGFTGLSMTLDMFAISSARQSAAAFNARNR